MADYTWLGSALQQRDTTSDTSYTIGETEGKPAFKTEFQRDGILRVSAVVNELTTPDQDDFPNLGSWTYGYDSASNALSAAHTGDAMDELESTQHYDYDTLNRLVSARVTDPRLVAPDKVRRSRSDAVSPRETRRVKETAASEETTSYQYDP